ncbi:predicted protein [Sclerotinia sclerotiorum 1980 UF-70]|uniref:Uncharacterized protein n=1 Tax=Sclerotinia sclerotiorum (strain ATCC 18683 / 1980 / Ss-1) TaxID=665079 RepID=A7EPR5_SCLS1|nr:predicted protein [Sclerotinia sclerotiorum 1980 UF-70]EDO04831.1 predicted protein [Sclerotinia sclerotiorum 1980 UF-70]
MDLERVVHRWSPSQRIIVELISNTEMLSDPTIQLSNYCVLTRKFIKVIKLVGRGRQIEVYDEKVDIVLIFDKWFGMNDDKNDNGGVEV